ncbi:hypothetical protein [Deinococcus sp. UYEF24]
MPDAFSLEQIFPPPAQPSVLLRDFCDWHAATCTSTYCGYSIAPTRLDDYWIEDGTDLADHFALFLRLDDGSMVGYWYPTGVISQAAPIVLLGSEGQTEVLADDLEGLLARIALGAFGNEGPLSSFLVYDDDEDEERQDLNLNDLTDWLRGRLGHEELDGLIGIRGSYPELRRWLDDWQVARRQAGRTNSILRGIGELLSRYRPATDWQTASFRVAIVGEQYEAWYVHQGSQPFPEAGALEPLVREARMAWVASDPRRGAWYVALVRLSQDGTVRVLSDFAREPDFQGDAPGAEQYAADLELFPRETRWMPSWLTTKVGF